MHYLRLQKINICSDNQIGTDNRSIVVKTALLDNSPRLKSFLPACGIILGLGSAWFIVSVTSTIFRHSHTY